MELYRRFKKKQLVRLICGPGGKEHKIEFSPRVVHVMERGFQNAQTRLTVSPELELLALLTAFLASHHGKPRTDHTTFLSRTHLGLPQGPVWELASPAEAGTRPEKLRQSWEMSTARALGRRLCQADGEKESLQEPSEMELTLMLATPQLPTFLKADAGFITWKPCLKGQRENEEPTAGGSGGPIGDSNGL